MAEHRASLRIILVLAFGYLVSNILAGVMLCDGTLHPRRRPLLPSDEARARSIAMAHQASFEDARITTYDGTTLAAWLITPQNPNGIAVILLHGLSDNRMGMIGYAELLLNHRFTILMPDARAHGSSGGAVATYGLLERNDIRAWFDWLNRAAHPTCIDSLGESMGAAQILQALSVEPSFCAVVAESSFSTFREIGYDRVGQFFRTGPWLAKTVLRPVIDFAFWRGTEKYRLDLKGVSPASALAQTHVPVLLIHGTADDNIPYRHAELILTRAPNVTFWCVSGAGHCGAINSARDFEPRLVAWFVQHQTAIPASVTIASP